MLAVFERIDFRCWRRCLPRHPGGRRCNGRLREPAGRIGSIHTRRPHLGEVRVDHGSTLREPDAAQRPRARSHQRPRLTAATARNAEGWGTSAAVYLAPSTQSTAASGVDDEARRAKAHGDQDCRVIDT